MKKQLSIIILILILMSFFVSPSFAQETTEVAGEVATEPAVVSPAEEVLATPTEESNSGFLDFLSLIGEAFNSYPGGFLSAAVAFIFISRFTNNAAVVKILEKQFDNLTNSYPPQTLENLRKLAGGFGGSLVEIGGVIKEISDGVPLDEKNQTPPKTEIG